MTAALTDKRVNTRDLEGVNFPQIEKEIMDDIQSPCGGNGWCRTDVIMEVPTGKKSTANSRRTEKRAHVRMQHHDEVDPDADPFPLVISRLGSAQKPGSRPSFWWLSASHCLSRGRYLWRQRA